MTLELDTRQRALLEAMGVKVWWPETAAALAEVALAAPSAPVVARAPAAPVAPPLAQQPAVAIAPAPASGDVPPNTASRPLPPRPVAPAPTAHALAMAGLADLAPRPVASTLDWPALQQAVAGCRACGLCNGRKNTVFGVGQAPATPEQAPQVDWLIVGEAPGENEDLQGEPFVGQAGKLLDNMLKAMGLARTRQVYIANVLKCRPPANRNPLPEEVAQCAPYLQRQVELLQPKIILAMGRFAVQTLLADSVPEVHAMPLGKLRGQVYAYHGVPVVVSYHPAYLLRNLADKAKAWADLCLALKVIGPR